MSLENCLAKIEIDLNLISTILIFAVKELEHLSSRVKDKSLLKDLCMGRKRRKHR